MKVIGYKVWYHDGTKSVVSVNGDPETIRKDAAALPRDGVLVIMVYYDEFSEGLPNQRYRRICQGTEFYFIHASHGDMALGQDNGNGRSPREYEDEVAFRYPGAVVLRGKDAPASHYQAIVDEAMADHDYSPFE